jgi:succinyl-diaminopimelate desuccinylase
MRKEIIEACKRLDSQRDGMVKTLVELCRIPAISPYTGGEGEEKKVRWLTAHLKKLGFKKIERYDCPDKKAPTGTRPSLVVRIPGKDRAKTIWVVTHTDIVPAGDLKKWVCDPFKPIVKGGKVIGRGVEDNGQALVSSLYAAKALLDMKITPRYNVALAFVADEEVGSKFGIEFLIKKGLFRKNDLFVVPDVGIKDGGKVEIAEKSIMWMKVTTAGRQTHGASPQKGVNAHKWAMKFAVQLDDVLYKKYGGKDKLFSPDFSTFEPTKKEANVPNVNTIPGEDVFYLDCRVLPMYDMKEVIATIKGEAAKIEAEGGVKINLEIINGGESTPATSTDSEVYRKLSDAIEDVKGVRPEPFGIGGGTCAALFRKAGYPAVVWTTSDETAHDANEYISIDNMVVDAKVYASLFIE